MRKYWFILFVILFGVETLAQSGFQLKGQTDMSENEAVVILKISANSMDVVDTVYTDKKGRFSYEGDEPESVIYYLTFGSAQPPGIPLVVENGAEINLHTEIKDFFPHTITGGKYSEQMHSLHALYTHYDSILTVFNNNLESLKATAMSPEQQLELNKEYQEIISARTRKIEEFIIEQEASPVLFFAARFLFSRPEPRIVIRVAEKLQSDMPNSAYTTSLLSIRNQFKPTDEGSLAPDLALESPKGDTVRLSSLKGEVVLLDFWASWCGPCRKENPQVRAMYQKYKDRGFEIYGVSLDHNATQWKIAIQQDQLPWIHVSDLKAWSSIAAKIYDVHGIPQTFLIDKDGRIHRSGLRGEQLEAELEYLLNRS